MPSKPFKSPKHKLLNFFLKSRNLWRQRAKDYHQEMRSLEIRLRDLEISRDLWRAKYYEDQEPLVADRIHPGHEPPPHSAITPQSSTRETED